VGFGGADRAVLREGIGKHRFDPNRSWTMAAAYGAINPERIAYRTMLAVS
jgi:hypothetical protein